ncbi:MAG: thiamine pyrophosphate-dependent dehydrogenase E1 component subunit alpha [Anaerolineales bacterium]|nr:thiamine pyrophosphate-dependent dehydrogenase E1 component subunit alpha [Anaerolineales bacterium]
MAARTDQLAPLDLIGFDTDFLLGLYRRMVQAREFEEQLYYLFLSRPMPGTMHQATGQEAVAVGVTSALRPDDYVTSTHRGHAHCVAKGVELNPMMAEMFAKRTGSCKGMGGSMHLCDFSRGMLGAFGIVGAGIPIAAGAALSALVRGSGQVAVSFFGDGATNEGVFHEALNMASLWKLPVIFVCENNQYALSMTVSESSAVPDIAKRGAAYAIPGVQVDGNNVIEVLKAAQAAVERARAGAGPTLLECITYRIRGHARFEASHYRDPAEVEQWKQLDPITRLGDALLADGRVQPDALEQVRNEVKADLEAAIAFAESSPDVEPDEYLQYIFDEEPAHA